MSVNGLYQLIEEREEEDILHWYVIAPEVSRLGIICKC